MSSYAMTIAISSAAIYSVLDPISSATDLSVANLNAGTGYMVNMDQRVQDLANLWAVPVFWMGMSCMAAPGTCVWKAAGLSSNNALHDGMLLEGSVGNSVVSPKGQIIMIWAPFTTNNGQWIANKILQGFFGAPLEALCEISMTDIVRFDTAP